MVAVSVGPLEIGIVVLVLILLFGAKKLPELARSIGKSTSEFKKGVAEGGSDADEPESKEPADKPPAE